MIESGLRGQVQPDSPQDTPPEANPRPVVPSAGRAGLHWGIGTLAAAMVVLSTLVLGSYQGQLAAAQSGGSASVTGTAGEPEPESGREAGDPIDPMETRVPAAGSGEVAVAGFTRAAPGSGDGRRVRVRVEVEREMPVDPEAAARQAADILQDERSWTGKQNVQFDFVGSQAHDLVIRVLTPATTDQRCLPLKTLGRVSCSQGSAVNLNGLRWVHGVPDYQGDLDGYRTYLINHEVGHYLGYGHVSCPGPGQPAPVMMQQTKGLLGCTRNPWP